MPDAPGRVVVRPILDEDVAIVAEFLHRHLNGRVPASVWAAGIRPDWRSPAPNHGFQLVDDDRVVGANLAFYSTRPRQGHEEQVCNLGALCVLEAYRGQAIRLMRAVLKQSGYTFTDLSPSGNVPELNRRLGFAPLDTTTSLTLNLPWPSPRGVRIVHDLQRIEELITGPAATLFADHRHAPAAVHVLVLDRGEQCYVVARRDRRKGLPLFISVLHVTDQAVFRRCSRAVLARLFILTGAPLALLEERVVGRAPLAAVRLASPRPKMVKAGGTPPNDVDYLYSELTQIPW